MFKKIKVLPPKILPPEKNAWFVCAVAPTLKALGV
jgi:hypothetical protein